MAKKIEVFLDVPPEVHLKISRGGKAVSLEELVQSHVRLPVRSHFSDGNATFEWLNLKGGWIDFCNGKVVKIAVKSKNGLFLAEVHHGADRVVYVNPVSMPVKREEVRCE